MLETTNIMPSDTTRCHLDNNRTLPKHISDKIAVSAIDKSSFLSRILLFGDKRSGSKGGVSPEEGYIVNRDVQVEIVKHAPEMKNVEGVSVDRASLKVKPAMRDQFSVGVVTASKTVTLNRIALSKFLNDLREDVVSDNVFGDRAVTGRVDADKDGHGREVSSDGERLKMKSVIEDEAETPRVLHSTAGRRSATLGEGVEKRGTHVRVVDDEGRRGRDGVAPRKVSFKVNKVSAGGRRNKVSESRVVLNSSKVAALASKYNSLVDKVDTSKANDGTIVIKTPHTKQDIKVVVSRKSSTLKRDNSSASLKNAYKKIDDATGTNKTKDKKNISLKYKPPALKSRSGNVKAAIQIFEQNSTLIKVKSSGSMEDRGPTKNEGNSSKQNDAKSSSVQHMSPRISSLYKDCNTEFKRKVNETEDERIQCPTNSVSKSENGDCACVRVSKTGDDSPIVVVAEKGQDERGCTETPLVQNQSVLFGTHLHYGSATRLGDTSKTKDCDNGPLDTAKRNLNRDAEQVTATTARGDRNSSVVAEEGHERYIKIEEGRHDAAHGAAGVATSTKTTLDTHTNTARRISKITKKVITFPGKKKSVLTVSGPETKPQTKNTDSKVPRSTDSRLQKSDSQIENMKGKSSQVEDTLEDYEKIGPGLQKSGAKCAIDQRNAGDYMMLNEATTKLPERRDNVNPHTTKGVSDSSKHQVTTTPNVRPNSSFLWGAPSPVLPPKPGSPSQTPPSRPQSTLPRLPVPDIEPPKPGSPSQTPPPRPQSTLPRPPVPDIEIPDMYAYDDVYPPSDSLHYSSVNVDDIYDDIGVDRREVGRSASNLSTGTTYDVIGNVEVTVVTTKTKSSEEESTSCRYDYVSSHRCEAPNYQELDDNIYDDVKTLSIKEDAMSVSNCYESIYDGGTGSTKEAVNSLYGIKGAVKYGSSEGSSISSKSYCEQNNSLYGGLLGPRFESGSASQASTASAEDAPHEVMSYQLTSLGVTRSDTSDEWVDLEPSDSEHEQGTINLVVHERSRCRRSPSWSQKVRRQWSKSPQKYAGASGGESSDDSDHHYEMLDDVVDKVADIPFDDFDSFDSDTSNEETVPPKHPEQYNNRLPEPPAPQNIYGITKIAEAAGNKLLKLRKSLSRMRPKRHTTEIHLSNTGISPPPLSIAPSPPAPLEKTTSAANLSNKKYWSLRKFKRSSSTLGQPASTFYVTDAVNADTGQTEREQKRNSLISQTSEISNGYEATSPSSSKTSVNDIGAENGVRKNSKPTIVPERRTSVRPNSPPPLPPPLANAGVPESTPKRPNRKDKRSTSWYAECGLFDGSDSPGHNGSEVKRSANRERVSSNSWYAEVGLWNESSSSSQPNSLTLEHDANNSAEVSDCSLSPENSGVERRFTDEPLYQFYTASIVELARRDMSGEFDSDGYEEIGDRSLKNSARPSAMELIQPREGLHRTLWCQIPEVINSRVLSTINPHQKKLQEAKFEIIASEASYIKSLNVLEKHFISSAEFNDESVLSKSDRRILFSNVAPVKTCSKRFLEELEKCWQANILLDGICDVIFKHATENFNAYVKYCSNQIYLDRTLRRLKDQHGRFADVLTQLEGTPGCQSLSLHSFLMLPMQRITRLPLLVDAVLRRLNAQDDEYTNCKMALATLNKIVKDCNEGARRMERMEEILILSRQLEFPREIKAVPIISSSRWLVRSGELTQLVFRGDEAKLTFGKKFSKSTLHFFLFTDLLVITKKKSEECYVVTDYCPRNMAQMSSGEGLTHLPVKFSSDGGRNLMLLTMLQNHERKTVEMILSCGVESDRQRWLQAISQPMSDNPEESVYEQWDCPQVTTIHPFTPSQPDELALDISDVVNVFRKTPDGWYHGERIRDGEQGWFPGNYTVEVASAHVRARNLKQRYRLLALSANYLDSQRKDKK